MRRVRGFTLVEVLIALAIVGMLLTIAFSGLRVAMAAWTRGEDRAEAHQHVRAIAFTFQNEDGDWVDTWDGQDLKAIPRGIQLRLGSTVNGRAQTLPPITVTLRTTGSTR